VSAHPREELPGLVLGELAPDAAAEVYGHLDECGRCQLDLDAVRHASDALKASAAVPEGERLVLEPPGPARPRRPRPRVVVLVALLVVLVSGIAGVASLRGGRQQAGIEAGPATALAAVGGGDASGQAKVTGDARRKVVTLETMRLPAPGGGRYYQAWLARNGQAPSLALGVLATDNQGLWSVPASITQRYQGQLIEVWLEPDDGNPAATGRAVLRGPFRP
jgi:anti-sigma factor RsiW